MTDVKYLVWLDLETTGLTSMDSVLEVGAVLTDATLNQLGKPFHYVYGLHTARNVAQWEPVVVEMHTQNGLLLECAKLASGGFSDKGVDTLLVDWVQDCIGQAAVKYGEYALAGAGVSHYDHGMVRDRYHHFAALLHYATIDVSVIRRFAELVIQEDMTEWPQGRKLHRAIADVGDALVLARWLQARMDWAVVT